MEWMLMPYRRYAEFSGRSRRKEFWMYHLFNIIVVTILYAIVIGGGGLSLLAADRASADAALEQLSFGPAFWVGLALLCLWGLANFIPSFAVTVRRLHDRNMSGWYLVGLIVAVAVLSVIPLIGPLLMLVLEIGYIVLLALPGTSGPNDYGPDPMGGGQPEAFA